MFDQVGDIIYLRSLMEQYIIWRQYLNQLSINSSTDNNWFVFIPLSSSKYAQEFVYVLFNGFFRLNLNIY